MTKTRQKELERTGKKIDAFAEGQREEYGGLFFEPLSDDDRAGIIRRVEQGQYWRLDDMLEELEVRNEGYARIAKNYRVKKGMIEKGNLIRLGNSLVLIDILPRISDELAEGISCPSVVFPQLAGKRTWARWHARGKKELFEGGGESDSPYKSLYLAIEEGRTRRRMHVEKTAFGAGLQMRKDRYQAAVKELARMDRAEDPLRLAKVEEAQANARLARLKTRFIDKAEELFDAGDYDGALRMIGMKPGDGASEIKGATLLAEESESGQPDAKEQA